MNMSKDLASVGESPTASTWLTKHIERDAPRLAALLLELKQGLEEIKSKAKLLIEKVKEDMYPTKDGISYLDVKYLLLLSYCQCLVYYLLRKAEGSSVKEHPVILQLVEIRLFLEKIRPIDKRLRYQIDKLSRAANNTSLRGTHEETSGKGDALKYKPNPDMLVSKLDESVDERGVYKPPKFAPTAMHEEIDDKAKKLEERKQKEMLRKASRSAYVKDLANDLEGRPEEVKETVGVESKELSRELLKLEKRAQQEEELFVRVPLSRLEKKKLKHLKRSRNGLMGFLDDFNDDISGLMAMDDKESDPTGTRSHGKKEGKRKLKKRRR
eukprot:TRINITY_DN10649_c0_g1_i1.p1 TRINITY_DN10649_c0_g1~~TRINITY_DN10649_c0_g1_i1.p1  ORF type:complete len:326 (-),score=85.64 TRINITY_DN10649_c0_g1_i1:368-1345(-)